MRILITGAAGFIGGQLVRHFAALKEACPSLSLVATARQPGLVPELRRLLDDYVAADLAVHCPPMAATVCIHAAGLADDRSPETELYRANVTATRNLIEALDGCRQFVYISSASVYGVKAGPLREDDAAGDSATSDYGRSKWAGEQVVRERCSGRSIPHVILRPRAVYGVGDRVLLPRLLGLMRPPALLVIGSGAAETSLTYVGHLASLVATLVFGDAPCRDGVFNVADDAVYRFEHVLSALYVAIHHRKPMVVHIPVPLVRMYVRLNELVARRGPISRQSLGYLTQSCVLDCTRARDLLGYAPSTTLFDHVETLGRAVSTGRRRSRLLRGDGRK